MNLVFCGTPEFAVPTLNAVLEAGHQVSLVLTQPDRPSGRGMQLQASPVKQAALAHAIAVEQPTRLRTNDALAQQLQQLAPDAILVVAYGRIIPPWMLQLPRFGNLNLHGSLLPKYRGAAPIQWAIALGETETGVTTMRLDEGLDTGPMLLRATTPVLPEETALDLYPRLAQMGAALMVSTLAQLESGTLVPEPQDDAAHTLAPILTREDGHILAERTAAETYNRWRGLQPWPGAWLSVAGRKLLVTSMKRPGATETQHTNAPGTLLADAGRLWLVCADCALVELAEVQPEGKRRMPAADFLRGTALAAGTRIG
jgi:methionyl-tRNA formyltransferase